MLNNKFNHFPVLLALVFSSQAFAAPIADDFTQAVVNDSPTAFSATPSTGNGMNWAVISPACLTAGTNSGTTPNNSGTSVATTNAAYSSIPGCNLGTPDLAGSGALRLTPATSNQAGAIISNGTFPSNQGLQITFTTYTYGGTGADGIGFFLQDASVGTTLPYVGGTPGTVAANLAGTISTGLSNIGESGGSLGYSCSNSKNVNWNGLTGAYLGLGMDEYGNFLNGANGTNDNTATGIGFSPNTIGLRGGGNVSWYWLNNHYSTLYPSTLSAGLQQAAVENTCKTGTLWDYSGATSQNITSLSSSGTTLTVTVPSVTGYVIGDSVTIGGTITATAVSQAISSATVSGLTMTVTVPNISAYSNGNNVTFGGAINATALAAQSISSFNNYSSSTVRVNVGSASSNFAPNESVTISGVTGTNASVVNNIFTISSVVTGSSGYLVIPVASKAFGNTPSYPTAGTGNVSAAAPTISGNTYSISSVTATTGGAGTFKVTLSSAASSITNTSGTVSGAAPTIPGTYAISNVNNAANTFTISLGFTPGTITNTSGTVSDNSWTTSGRNLGVNVSGSGPTLLDYPVIPGGYSVLPSTKKLATSALTRAAATPITYRLTITPGGLLTFMFSYNGGAYQSVLTNFNIENPLYSGPLPSNFRFGFLGSTGGSTDIHEITCFAAEPVQSTSSIGANTIQSGQVRTGTQVYLASYNPNGWMGSLVSDAIVNTAGTLSVSTVSDWDANCVLTGGGCANMGLDSSGNPLNTITVESPLSPSSSTTSSPTRQLLTWSGTAGIPLEWSSIVSAQQTVLNSTDSNGQYRLNWLRGDRSQEQGATPTPGTLRTRGGVLGDIVDSSPVWVGPPSGGYAASFTDVLYPGNTVLETSYAAFSSSMATRTNVVYSGSNDGLLHGFRTGSNNADGTYNSTNNDGYEVIGYMPSTVLASANVVGLTNPTYGHNYFVDAAPGTGDLFYGGAWHTWLVGGIGPGGKEIYALDITDPTQFSETNAVTLVKGDWTTSSTLGANLGNTYGIPLIRRLHNGQWAIIFGNGLGSANGTAGVFIGLVNSNSGAVTFSWLPTNTATANGIAYVSSADLDGDHVTDYLYAGDLLGNVWRFDLTSSNPADWGASTFGHTLATPLFIANKIAGTVQPITTKIAVTGTTTGGKLRVVLGFGTGQATPFTTASGVTYASGQQTVYGIWDWDMNLWNNGTTTANGVTIPAATAQFAALPELISTGVYQTASMTRANLLLNTATETATTRTMAISNVSWCGSSTCSSPNNQYGWYFDLPGLVNYTPATISPCGATPCYEQVIYSPVFAGGDLLVNTTIPATATVAQCTPSLPSGWSMIFNMASGGGFFQNAFPDSTGSLTVATGSNSLAGVKQGSVGTPYVVSVGSKQYEVNPSASGGVNMNQINLQNGVTVKRMTWEQLR